MKIIGLLTTKNESGRYLESCLKWNSKIFDELYIYDDQSTDSTVEICSEYGKVKIREDNIPTFMDHEGNFRQAAWEWAGSESNPDWIMTFDADEFIVPSLKEINAKKGLYDLASYAESVKKKSVLISIPEIWEISNPLKIRKDGFWAKNSNPRLIKWNESDTVFLDKPMGSGNGPAYCWKNPLSTVHLISILHFGYAKPEDRQRRYERYKSINNHGHNKKHIDSIIDKNPSLTNWLGSTPKVSINDC
jgi:glycosyltransferase involved in cell wall biosynthesis